MIRRVDTTGPGTVLVSLVALAVVAACGPAPNPPATPTPTGAGTLRPSSSAKASSSPASDPSPSVSAATVWSVTAAAPMLRARDGFRAVTLGDGSLLVVGDDQACMPGPASPGSATAERYDPVADAWSPAAPLNKARKDFAMVPSPDGGAMVVGGVNDGDQPFSSTKRFDLATGRWSDGPLLRVAYGDPSAAMVQDGRIYVAGPTITGETASTSTVEILAPGRSGWDDGGRIPDLSVSGIVRLSDDRLVAVGSTFESPELLYVHDSGGAEGWLPLPLTGFDGIDELVPLPGGGILAFGWAYDPAVGDTRAAAPRRFDPATGAWAPTGPMATPRSDAQRAVLRDGRVVVAGGIAGSRDAGRGTMLRSSEIYDPVSDAWTAGPDLLGPREGGRAMPLRDGSVLILGGVNVTNTGGDTPFCPGTLTAVERLRPAP